MLQNYFKILVRQIFKRSTYTIINIGGLAVGLSAVLLIACYVQFEWSYGSDLSYADQLYRVNVTSLKEGTLVEASARTSPAMGSAFKREIGAVEGFSRVIILGEAIVGHKADFVREKDIFLADTNYFDFFDCTIVNGAVDLMQKPLMAMISEKIAHKIFGNTNPVGKTLEINSANFDGTVNFEIAGVFQSLPENRHIRPQVIVSYASLYHFMGKGIDQSYSWQNLYTYLKLNQQANIVEVEGWMNATLQSHYGENLKSSNIDWQLHLQPITDIHTNTAYIGEYERGIDGEKIKYFVWIGVFILILIYLNSINLINAKAFNRSKEVGVRKVSGGSKRQLFFQFMLESLIINFIAILIAVVIISALGSTLTDFLDLSQPESIFSFSNYYMILIGLWVFGALLTGLYPAIVLTSFSPSQALKGRLKFKLKGAFAKPLTIMQLVTCLVILAGTLTVYLQVSHMRQQELGIALDNKIVVRSPMLFIEGSGNYQKIMHEKLTSLEGIKNVAATNEIPGNEVYWRSDQFHRKGVENDGTMYAFLSVGAHYFNVFDIQLKAGRYFNTNLEPGSEAIINEKARRALGFIDNATALGQKLYNGESDVEIVGVVGDYHQQGVNKQIEPMVLNYSGADLNYYIVELTHGDIEESLQKIKATFMQLFPTSPFEYYFLDEHFDKQYKSDQQFAQIFSMAAIIAIIIVVMGILGVTTQLLIQRSKEVSIRKILGASAGNVFQLISKEYVIWLLICYAIGIPMSYYLFSAWLDNFIIRIDLGWWFFVIPVLLIAVVFILSTVYQTIKTALVNPAEILKNE